MVNTNHLRKCLMGVLHSGFLLYVLMHLPFGERNSLCYRCNLAEAYLFPEIVVEPAFSLKPQRLPFSPLELYRANLHPGTGDPENSVKWKAHAVTKMVFLVQFFFTRTGQRPEGSRKELDRV